jgi:hypothetical protein
LQVDAKLASGHGDLSLVANLAEDEFDFFLAGAAEKGVGISPEDRVCFFFVCVCINKG